MKRFSGLLQLTVFFLIIAAFVPTSHAIVVAPLVAVGIVKIIIFLIGLLTVPVTFLVKTFTKTKFMKAFGISLLILLALAGVFYATHKLSTGTKVMRINPNSAIDETNGPVPNGSTEKAGVPLRSAPPPTVFLVKDQIVAFLHFDIPGISDYMFLTLIFGVVLLLPTVLTLYIIEGLNKNWSMAKILLVSVVLSFSLSFIGMCIVYIKTIS